MVIGISSVERIGIEKGLAQGRVTERRDLLLHLLTRRFGPLPAALQSQMRELSPEQLLALSEALFDLTSLEAVQQWVAGSGS